jgi:hypothetical protein
VRKRSRIRRSSPAAPTPACFTIARTVGNCRDGELLLIDAGCEYQGYASDITRTFPVNGRFSGPQKAIYEVVLAAQQACLDAVRPGAEFHDYHKTAERVLAQGYIDVGLCHGTLDEVLETGAYRQFYMHRAGHWLGMDVHDAGLYQLKGASQKARSGMVLTVEPGTYIRPADNVPDEFWDIGIRIEDDVLVTSTGIENLTLGAPKTVADVEATCRRTVTRGAGLSNAARSSRGCSMMSSLSAQDRSARRWRCRWPPAISSNASRRSPSRANARGDRSLASIARRAPHPRASRRLGCAIGQFPAL